MKLPGCLSVFGKDYIVKEADKKILKDEIGVCEYWNQLILIDKNLQKDCTLETLLHEVIHAIDGETGLSLKEVQIRLLSQGLYDVLKHNPGTWKLIWRKS